MYERWETTDPKAAEQYARIVTDCSQYGFGVAWERVIVVGMEYLSSEGGERCYGFEFLFLREGRDFYSRVEEGPVFALRKEASRMRPAAGFVIYNSSSVETLFTAGLVAFNKNEFVTFVEEFIPLEQREGNFNRRVIQRRLVPHDKLLVREQVDYCFVYSNTSCCI